MGSPVSVGAAGRSGGSLAMRFCIAGPAIFQVALRKRNPPLEGEMDGVGNESEWKLVLNRPEFSDRTPRKNGDSCNSSLRTKLMVEQERAAVDQRPSQVLHGGE